tara:strand:+ start:165 stop:1154 length:990 start_codon:yes stop_codon:yes gene_type:complete
MKNYTDDPQLRTLREVISDPKNKLNSIKFAKGALYKDSIHIHPTNDSIDKKIYFAFVRASKLLVSSSYQRYICVSTIKKAKQFNYLLCQTLVVALRPDGSYVIIDGQHKGIMSVLSGEDLDLPCQIFKHDINASLSQCIKIEAQLFEDLNNSRKNTSTLDKVRAGLSYGDDKSKEFQDNFVSIGVQAEGIGYEDGVEVNGWAKATESISKWKIPNTRRAVDFLRPIYETKWNLEYVDGSMVGGLAATFSLIEACGSGDKAKGLKTYIKTYFSNVSRSKWTENTRGQSDVLIARKIVTKYNDLLDQGIIEGANIGEDLLTNNRLKNPATL